MSSAFEKEKTALFIGHNECYGVTSGDIEQAIETAIKSGITVFLNGGQGGFDRMCASCLHRQKKRYPHIISCLVIPYLDFNIFDKDLFNEIIYPEGFENKHYKYAIPARNKYMVENASYAICYVTHSWGGAAKTFELAKKKNLKIVNINHTKIKD